MNSPSTDDPQKSAYSSRVVAERALSAHLSRPCRLITTRNRQRILSCSERDDVFVLRLQASFLQADQTVWQHIFAFCAGQPYDRQAIQSFFRPYRPQRRRAPKSACRAQGRTYDLKSLAAQINARYFDGRLKVAICWGRGSSRTHHRTRRLGCYMPDRGLIRLHPCLDTPEVPVEVVLFVIYHEMLHAELGYQQKNGRRYWHTAEFRRREKYFTAYEKVANWPNNS